MRETVTTANELLGSPMRRKCDEDESIILLTTDQDWQADVHNRLRVCHIIHSRERTATKLC